MGPQNTKAALDGGWGWVIMVVSFMGQLLSYGPPLAVGVLYPEWLSVYQEGKGLTAWVGSLVSSVGLIASPVCGACVVNFGARPVTVFSGVMVAGGLMLSAFAPNVQFLIFSYGIVVGLGCGLVYSATVTITCQYFDKRRGLALGIVTTGCSVGGFLYATILNELIELFGLDGCLLVIGALSLNLMACAGPMRPLHVPAYYLKQKAAFERNEEHVMSQADKSPGTENMVKSSVGTAENGLMAKDLLVTVDTKDSTACDRGFLRSATLTKIIKDKQRAYAEYMHTTADFLHDPVFLSLCVTFFLFTLGAFPPVLLIEDVAQSEGLIDEIATIPLVSIVAITTGLGKLVLGVMADLRWINSLYLYSVTLAGCGLALLIIPVTKSYLGLQILCGVVGFFSGIWSIMPYVTTKIVGIDRLAQSYGILMFFSGIGIMFGSPVIGWFYDWTQSYDLAFYLTGGSVVLGAVAFFFCALPCCNKKKNERGNPTPSIQYTGSCEKVASVA